MIAQQLIGELLDLSDLEKTGRLTLRRGQERVTIDMRDGLIESASSTDSKELRLGRLMVERRMLRPSRLKSLLQQAGSRKTAIGETLVNAGLVNKAELERLVELQARYVLQYCLEKDFSVDSFSESFRQPGIPCRVRLSSVLLPLVRGVEPEPDLLSGRWVALRQNKLSQISSWPWNPLEVAVIGQLVKASTLPRLLEKVGIEESRLASILTCLIMLRFVRVSERPIEDFAPSKQDDGLPLQILVPQEKGFFSDMVEVTKGQHSFVNEQFKSLKVRLSRSESRHPPQVIGISSPFPEDGKSLISANLSLCFSQDPGRRVVLLDCDLRRPSIQDYLGISVEPGVGDYLSDGKIEPYCYLKRVRNLFVMPAGRAVDNPVELLALDRMEELIDNLRREFDTVIVDCPPLEPISDARILAKLTDGLVLVVRSGKTPYSSAARALRNIDSQKLLGVVLNDVRPMLFNTYYNYGYYHYGRDNGYPYSSGRGVSSDSTL